MEDRIDIEKIEEAALSAIDELFSETSKGQEDPEIQRLEEAILALDWEFSQEELIKLKKSINDLKAKYQDKINHVLLTISENIIKFLISSKELAPPNSLTILGQIIKIFKEINRDQLKDKEKAQKVKEAYKIFTIFKQEVEKIREEFKKKIKEKTVAESEESKEYKINISEIIQKIENIIESKLEKIKERLEISEDIKLYVSQELEKINKKVDQLNKDVKSLIVSVELLLNLKEDLEKINTKIEELKKEPINYSQELFLEEKEESLEKLEKEANFEKESISEKEELMEDIEKDIFDIEYPYVKLFFFGKHLVAIPIENISNIYNLSSSKIAKLKEKKEIALKEIKSFWKKLKSNIKGPLKELSEKDLERLKVPILNLNFLKSENITFSSAVLVTVNNKSGIIFLGKDLKKVILPEKGIKSDQEGVIAQIETPEGEAYLIDLEYLMGTANE